MSKRIHVLMACWLGGASVGLAQTPGHSEGMIIGRGELDQFPVSLEVRYALSALPPALREKAAVYVLDPAKGYVLEREGSNGQSCFVGRTEWKFADYRNDVFDPICYDAQGANQMRVWFDVAELRVKGVAPEAMKHEIQNRFRTGEYKAPDRPGFSYMTAPVHRTYMSLDPKDKDSVMTMSMPHVMYYAPAVANPEVGGMPCPPCAPYPFVFEAGPHGYFIQRLGESESAKIVADEARLLKDLCEYRSFLCLTSPPSAH